MINDIPTFMEIIAQDHKYRPDEEKIPEADVKEIEDLIKQLEKFIDKTIDGDGSTEYPQFNLLSDRVKNILLILLFDELRFWRSEDERSNDRN